MGSVKQTVICLSSASFEHRLRAGLWAITAVSVGESVQLFLVGEALRLFCTQAFDKADESPVASPVADRASKLGLPLPSALLSQARELGPVRTVTCTTEIALAGLDEEHVRQLVDEVTSLPSLWRETSSARWLTL